MITKKFMDTGRRAVSKSHEKRCCKAVGRLFKAVLTTALLMGCLSGCGTAASLSSQQRALSGGVSAAQPASAGTPIPHSAPAGTPIPHSAPAGTSIPQPDPAGTSIPQSAASETTIPQSVSPQTSAGASALFHAISAEVSGECTGYAECTGDELETADHKDRFKPYEQFGLTYDAAKDELQYNGKTVRWFQDYYPLSEDGAQAGMDFFNEDGTVDIYAVRDLDSIVRSEDGSYDPGGKLTGIKEFSAEEFAARDIEAIKNPRPVTAISGDRMLTGEELKEMAKEYEAFGITYDAWEDQWYWNGEKVRFFRDVLISNGESLTGGKFKGTMRTLGSRNGGTIDVYTVRDFTHLDESGNGTLTGIEKFSQEEFDERTRSGREAQDSSGFCTVMPENK